MTDPSANDRNNSHSEKQAPGAAKKRPGVLKIMQSILAGALGVQSSKRREEDFASHSPWPYIFAGVLFTVGFVITLLLIVNWVVAG